MGEVAVKIDPTYLLEEEKRLYNILLQVENKEKTAEEAFLKMREIANEDF